MNNRIHNAAKALGLSENVVAKFLALIKALQEAPSATVLSASAPQPGAADERTQILIEEYDRKL